MNHGKRSILRDIAGDTTSQQLTLRSVLLNDGDPEVFAMMSVLLHMDQVERTRFDDELGVIGLELIGHQPRIGRLRSRSATMRVFFRVFDGVS